MREVQRQRAALAVPLDAPQRVEAHLAIAQRLPRDRGQGTRGRGGADRRASAAASASTGAGATARQTFDRALTREQHLAGAVAQREPATCCARNAAHAVLQHLLQAGSINKSGYARLCGVGLATASKHLGLLAERGLLVQTGKGPSTRYQLP